MNEKLIEKIQNHPRSQVARAYRLGLDSGSKNGLFTLVKTAIHYYMLKAMIGSFPSRIERNRLKKAETKLLDLTK